MNDLVNHLEDRVGELQHRIRDELDYHVHATEETLTQDEVILLEQVHQRRNNHWHERHRIRLASHDVPDSI